MIPVLVASNTAQAGRTFVSLGLCLKLREHDLTIGYMKPLGKTPIKQETGTYDADALFVRDVLNLADPLESISPFVKTYENQSLLFQGRSGDVLKQVTLAAKAFRKQDFLIVGGAGDFFDGSLLRLDTLSLAQALKARVLVVEPWRGDSSVDVLAGARTLLGRHFLGGVLNMVPLNMVDYIRNTVKPFLEQQDVPLFGAIPRDSFLESVTVEQLRETLNGRVLCCDDKLGEFVENFLVGAMDVDSAFNYFRRTRNKAVITGAHRTDIQLAALETSTKCIILTGGVGTSEAVLGKARTSGVPILSVSDDTFRAINKIELCMGQSSIRDRKKMDRARELFASSFDMFGFLSKTGKV